MENEPQAVLILYSNGNLQLPGATTWGEVMMRFEMVARLGTEMQRQMLAQPVLTKRAEDHPAE